jgi:nucleoside-diphosphate-sugar epimerase
VAPLGRETGARILVTGASGFVGRVLCPALAEQGLQVRRALRSTVANEHHAPGIENSVIGNIGPDTDWTQPLSGVSVVVHLSARTHVMHESAADPLAEYRRENVAATTALAQAAVHAGVRRLVFVSSIKVNGECTFAQPYTEADVARPEDAYGITKWEAEQSLAAIARDSGLEIVILRPPLVYGPSVKGNFLRLMRWVEKGLPLPLASIDNRRSLIYVGNLADAIIACIKAPAASGKTYLLSDGQDVSTAGLVRSIAAAMHVSPRLFRCPIPLLKLGTSALGKRAEFQRLTGSLQIDSSKIQRDLGWAPRYTLTQGLSDTVQWYYSQFRGNSNT